MKFGGATRSTRISVSVVVDKPRVARRIVKSFERAIGAWSNDYLWPMIPASALPTAEVKQVGDTISLSVVVDTFGADAVFDKFKQVYGGGALVRDPVFPLMVACDAKITREYVR